MRCRLITSGRLLIFFVLILFGLHGTGQNIGVQETLGKYVGASPSASSIAAYQAYPIDYMTGAPSISIPLLDINTKIGKIPFALSYHIGKIKPSELTGPVGFGWTLTPNLGISRSVKGMPDDLNSGYTGTNPSFGNLSDCQYLLSLSRSNIYDEQPDDFYYNLLGKGGRFVNKRDGSFSTIPFDPIKVSRPSTTSFVITDEDGTTYKFGSYSTGSTQCLEYSQSSSTVLTAWKITEIISYDKTDTIKFIYNPSKAVWHVPYYDMEWKVIEYPTRPDLEPKIYKTGFGFGSPNINAGWMAMRPGSLSQNNITDPLTLYDVDATKSGGSTSIPSSYPASCNLDYGADYADVNVFQDHYIDELMLTDIVFRGGKFSMVYSGKQLQSLILYANVNQIFSQVKKVDIYQHSVPFSYAQQQPLPLFNTINLRYLLDSVQLKGSTDVSQQTYKAAYIAPAAGDGGGMVMASGLGADMFGFPNLFAYNSVPAVPFLFGAYDFCNINYGNIPPTGSHAVTSGTVVLGGKQLNPLSNNQLRMPPGILQTITYPTGGTAGFTFERNIFNMRDGSSPEVGGGFRIQEIRYKTGAGIDSVSKIYKYGAAENGVGVIRYKPNAGDFMSIQYVNTTTLSTTGSPNLVQKITTVNSTPFKDMAFDNGAAVLYPYVTEYTQSAQGSTGKTVYAYNITSLNDTRLPMTPLQYNYRDDWRTSSLAWSESYRYKNSVYTPVQKTEYTYTDIIMDAVPVGMAYQQQVSMQPVTNEDQLICSNAYYPHFTSIHYSLQPGAKKLQQQVQTFYDADDSTKFVQESRTYDYDAATLLQNSQTEITSKNKTRQLKTWYPNNSAQLTNWPAGQLTNLSALVSANRINIVVKKQSLVNAIPQVTVQNYFLTADNGQLYASQSWAAERANALESKISINKYDQYGNVQDQQKANDVHEVYFWGYNGLYLVAKITGSDYLTAATFISQAILDNPATTDAQMRTELNKLRANLPNAQVNTYTYSPMIGMSSETDPTGLITYFEYDDFQRLLRVRDKDNNILKQYEYKFQVPALYYSAAKSGSFTRINCATGGVGSQVTYLVPASAYTSAISQADADAKAQNDVNTIGQAYANGAGTCTFPSAVQSGTYYSISCDSGGTANPVVYTIPAGTYTSTISQADADQQARQYMASTALGYASAHGTCTYHNAAKSGTYLRNNCSCGYTGSSVTYTVNAGTISSIVSQADANQQAQNSVTANGQNYANSNGTCTVITCSGTNRKIINCTTCERGVLGIISQVYSGGSCVTQYGYFFSDGSYNYDHTTTVAGGCP